MARSLNGGTADKPIVPLRFRINPKLRQLEEIEALERELKSSGLQAKDIDLFNDLLNDLSTRRSKVMPEPKPKLLTREEKAALKELEDEKRHDLMPFAPDPCKWRVLRYKVRDSLTEKAFGWVLFLFVIIWFYYKNKS